MAPVTTLLVLAATVATAGADRVSAQEVLLELPARAPALLDDDARDRTAAVRVGAQAELDEGQRMPFSPSLALRYRLGAAPVPHEPLAAAPQLGASVQVPTHGDARGAALRSLSLGPAMALESAFAVEYHPAGGLLIVARPWVRLEWQLAALDPPDGGRLQRIAPLVGAAGAQVGLAVGPWLNAAELSVAHHLIRASAPAAYLSEVERLPRLSLASTVLLTRHLQVFLRVVPRDGFFSSRAAWSAGLAASVAWSRQP